MSLFRMRYLSGVTNVGEIAGGADHHHDIALVSKDPEKINPVRRRWPKQWQARESRSGE